MGSLYEEYLKKQGGLNQQKSKSYEEMLYERLNAKQNQPKPKSYEEMLYERLEADNQAKEPTQTPKQDSFNERFLGLSDDEYEKLSKQRKAQKQKSQKLEQYMLNLSDDELSRILKQREEQKAKQTLPQEIEQNDIPKQNMYNEKAKDILKKKNQVSEITSQEQQDPTTNLSQQYLDDPDAFSDDKELQELLKPQVPQVAENQIQDDDYKPLIPEEVKAYLEKEHPQSTKKDPLVFGEKSVLRKSEQDKIDAQNAFESYVESKADTLENKILEDLSALGRYFRGEIDVEPNLTSEAAKIAFSLWTSDDELEKLDKLKQEKKQIKYTKEEYEKLYLESLDNTKFLHATKEQTQRFLAKNNLNDDFIKLYNEEARKHHFTGDVFEDAVVFAKHYKKELEEKTISDIKRTYATLEHFHETYNDSLAYFKSLGGIANENDKKALQTTRDNLNKDLKKMFKDMGYDLFISDDKMIATHKKSGFRFNLYDEKDSLVQSLLANKYEIAGAIGGAYAGAKFGAKSKNPYVIAGSTLAGSMLGGAGGANLDYLIDTIKLAKEFNSKDMLNKAGKSAMYDLATAGAFKALKGTTKGGFYLVKATTPQSIKNVTYKSTQALSDIWQKRVASLYTGRLSTAEAGLKEDYFKHTENIKHKEKVLDIHKELELLSFDPNKITHIPFARGRNIIDGILNTLNPSTPQRVTKQNEILAYMLSQEDAVEQIVKTLKENSNIRMDFIKLTKKMNSPLLEPLKKIFNESNEKYKHLPKEEMVKAIEKDLALNSEEVMQEVKKHAGEMLVGVLRDHKLQLHKDYEEVIKIATDTAKKHNHFYDTKTIYDDMMDIVNKGEYVSDDERLKFVGFLNNRFSFLKNDDGNFIKKQLSPEDINNLNNSMTILYDNIKHHNEFKVWKELKDNLNSHTNKYFDNLSSFRKKNGVKDYDLSKLFSNVRGRYAHYLEYINSKNFKTIQSVVNKNELVSLDELFEEQIKASGKIDLSKKEVINAINLQLQAMTPQQAKEYEEALILEALTRFKLQTSYTLDKDISLFFDKKNLTQVLKQYNFQSKEAKDYVALLDKINTIFSTDEHFIKSKAFLLKDPPESSQANLSDNYLGKIRMFFLNQIVDATIGWIGGDTNRAIRYQIYSAIYNSNTAKDIKFNLGKITNKLKSMPVFTKEKLNNLTQRIDRYLEFMDLVQKGNLDKALQLSPVGDLNELVRYGSDEEEIFLNDSYNENKLDLSKPIKYIGMQIPERQANEKIWGFLNKVKNLRISEPLLLIEFYGKKIYVTKPKHSDRFTLHTTNDKGEKEILAQNLQLYHINIETLRDLFDE